MPVDPVIHAEMAALVRRQKELEEERTELVIALPTWKKRVRLAEDKGMAELADEARQRLREVAARGRAIDAELEEIEDQKTRLRFEGRRPGGLEVRRAEAMVESVRMGGHIDPDEASLDAEFEELARRQPPARQSGGRDGEKGSSKTALDFGGDSEGDEKK